MRRFVDPGPIRNSDPSRDSNSPSARALDTQVVAPLTQLKGTTKNLTMQYRTAQHFKKELSYAIDVET